MRRKDILKRSLAILAAILLGAIGSGLWQDLLGPLLRATRSWVLDVASLGLQSFKDNVYRQIARSASDPASIENLNLLTLFYVLFIALGITYLFMQNREVQKEHGALSRRVERNIQGIVEHDFSLEEIKKELGAAGKSIRRAKWLLYLITVVAAFLITERLVSLARISYIHSAVSHYHQALKISSPYIDADQRVRIESQFAQIWNKKGYVDVVEQLARIARGQGQSVPEFKPW